MRGWMKEAREGCNFTMKECADKLDISESYYSMIEGGTRQQRIDIALAAKISCLFGVSLQYIVDKECE